ncbi:MAG: phosphotransferase, partial [Bacteroidales bacterium]|nr:phosphotransferase [Bacteroidales bacterium]
VGILIGSFLGGKIVEALGWGGDAVMAELVFREAYIGALTSAALADGRASNKERKYPLTASLSWVALGNAGGLSGARIWQGCSPDGRPLVCLKAWPSHYSADRLSHIHHWMILARHTSGLQFVPTVWRNNRGHTVTRHGNTLWDLTEWMPGTADLGKNLSPQRLIAAMTALAAVHRAWFPHQPQWAPCPGVIRRWEILTSFHPPHRTPSHLVEAVDWLHSRIPTALTLLEPWRTPQLPIQPCLCDPRLEHLLFTGDALTGLIDYGAAKWDHPAVDLARTLGDGIVTDDRLFDDAIAAYHACGGPITIPPRLVRVLADTGLVCAVVGWWKRLSHTTADDEGFARLQTLLGRLRSARFV